MVQQSNQYFLQSIEINDEVLPRESVTSVAYIEIAKLEAPLLLLNVRDVTGYHGSKSRGSDNGHPGRS
ncbi:hypothetical protein ID854_14610 [Xenorhabdus sp. M]|uniref:Uncharacterized protein n=1 Tax=Xenorhabdus szentirmaii TaxID=290112 RepID=A0AAW3YZR7_9GAMM|nr:hypothetical protein [Xenorhabdus sp. M]MBD2801643.1 hypothetical protein [Xenorhabdus sp. M]